MLKMASPLRKLIHIIESSHSFSYMTNQPDTKGLGSHPAPLKLQSGEWGDRKEKGWN